MLLDMQESSGFTPPALASRPTLSYVLSWAVRHFDEIAMSRTYTEGVPSSLSTQAIELHRQVFDIDCEKQTFHGYIRLIDDAWAVAWSAHRKKTAPVTVR